MSRYIDVDALLKSLTKFKENDWNKELCIPLPSLVDDCIDIVDEQPTADVVEVVRCEHCLHWDDEKDGVYVGNLYHCCDYDGEDKSPDDFCSYGERRTE